MKFHRVFYPNSFYYTSNSYVGKIAKERHEAEQRIESVRISLLAKQKRFMFLCAKYSLTSVGDREDLQQAIVRLSLGKFSLLPYKSFRSERDNYYYFKHKNRYVEKRNRARELTECRHIFSGLINHN